MAEVLYVTAHNHTFCIDINYVKKIIQLPELEFLPGAPGDVAGMLNYGGKIVPVYDMAILMGIDRKESYTLNTMVIICSHAQKDVGLIVDSIQGQDIIKPDKLDGETRIQGESTYLESVVTLNNTVVMIPAIKKIIDRQINLDEKL